jgi:hypothetical protein
MRTSTVRWVLAAVVILAIVGLIAYARGDSGDDGRSPELGAARAATAVQGVGG